MKQQQHDINLRRSIRLDHGGSWVQIPSATRIFFPSPPQINIMLFK